MKNRIIILILLLSLLPSGTTNAGNRKANRYFSLFRYSKAIPLYQKSVMKKSGQIKREATERLADCYRYTGKPEEACTWYARALIYYRPNPVIYYHYGQTLRNLGRYDEAKEAFNKYRQLRPDDKRGTILAGFCDQIHPLPSLPESVKIENASILNSEYSDFCPVYFKNGIVCTSDRNDLASNKGTCLWTGYGFLDLYYAEIVSSENSGETMSKPDKMTKGFNQQYHDGPVSFTGDFSEAYLTRTLKLKVRKDQNNIRTNHLQLFHASLNEPGEIHFEPLPFNNENYSSAYAAISKNGATLIFSSDMPGGYGESDLYRAFFREGMWSRPENMGPLINSFGDEVFPYQANDTTLFFASDGHPGYGGLDIYFSILRDGQWSEPMNIREPVNSTYDDFSIVFRSGMNNGFFSSNRPGGLGADDIYIVTGYGKVLNETTPEPAAQTGEELTIQTKDYMTEKSWFSVQVLAVASTAKTIYSELKGETVFSKTDDRYTRYFSGRFHDWNGAEKERNRLEGKFPRCFVVAFSNGELIPVNELRKILGK